VLFAQPCFSTVTVGGDPFRGQDDLEAFSRGRRSLSSRRLNGGIRSAPSRRTICRFLPATVPWIKTARTPGESSARCRSICANRLSSVEWTSIGSPLLQPRKSWIRKTSMVWCGKVTTWPTNIRPETCLGIWDQSKALTTSEITAQLYVKTRLLGLAASSTGDDDVTPLAVCLLAVEAAIHI
jgi:hypothetical protein